MKKLRSYFVLSVVLIVSSTVAFGQKNLSRGEQKIIRPAAGVAFQSVDALTSGDGVFLRWRMERETDNVGFQVVRVNSGSTEIVNFVPGAALKYRDQTVNGEEYSLFDPDGRSDSQYFVQSLEKNGRRTSSLTAFPSFVADLSPIAGQKSSSLVKRSETKTGYISSPDLIYTKALQSEREDHSQLADPVTQRWVAAQPGAKIGIRQTGVFRVTRAQLQAGGFDVNSDPAFWQLYTDGVEQPIIVGGSGDYIDFYGKSLDTVESDIRMYFLVVGPQAGRRMSTYGLRPSASTVKAQSFDQSVTVKERQFYLTQVFNGDAENYFGHFINTAATSTSINLPGVDMAASSVQLTVTIEGFSNTPHVINLTLNGHPIGQVTGGGGIHTMVFDFSVPASFLVEGANSLGTMSSAAGDFSFFDSVSVTYRRRYVSDQNKISFITQNYRRAILENFSTSSVRLFDITYDGEPVLVTGASITPNDGGGFDVAIPAYRSRVMFAVEDSGLLTPFSITANNPSAFSTGTHGANLIIISYKDFMTEANAWADYRRAQGVTVEVVNVEDVFDEFNYGVFSSNSIRDFVNFTRTNWQTAPGYVLLIGDSSYDSRNYEGHGYLNLVPTKLVDTIFGETASDDALVDFDNNGLAEVAIGRIPANTPAMVTNALSKTNTFETLSSTDNLTRGVTFAYDNPIGWDFQAMSQLMKDQLPPEAQANSPLIGRSDANPNSVLVADLNVGRYLANFNGHGTTGSWANPNNFSISHVPQLTNINRPTVYTMLTCLNGYFIGPNTSMAEILLNSTTGGAAAAWASTGETTPDIQQTMGIRFYNQVSAGQITRLGDLILDAKTVVTAGRDVRLSWVLIGDPMLKMR